MPQTSILPVFGAPSEYTNVVTSDTLIQGPFQYLRIGVAGNLVLKSATPGAVVTSAMAVTAGEYVPFGSGYIMATNTTASSIVAFS